MQEIERKYLLRIDPPPIFHGDKIKGVTTIRQGYIMDTEKGVLRVRKEEAVTTLTAKGRGLMSRTENEIQIDSDEFAEHLWDFVTGTVIKKTRYTLEQEDGLEYVVDVFHESLNGLVTMEIEFPSIEAADAYIPPKWIGSAVEVTHNPKYANSSLALNGLP